MVLSSFQFTNPVLLKAQFAVNDGFNNRYEMQIPMELNVSNNWDKESLQASVKLEITIGEESAQYPYYLKIAMGADFKWETGKYADEAIENLLNKNAPVLLLSYARPIIANITNVSPYSAQNLPYFDFTK